MGNCDFKKQQTTVPSRDYLISYIEDKFSDALCCWKRRLWKSKITNLGMEG
jgi:hypothetical protein